MEKPLVSIVIPCYNHAKFVSQAIRSVIAQDYENIELIIIDDGSTDSSVSTIQNMISACKFRFKRFEFRHRPNVGLCETLNEAISWCEGEYLSGMASDDIMKPNKTSLQVEYLNIHPRCAAVFGGIESIDQHGQITHNRVLRNKKYDFGEIFLNKHDLPSPTQMIRRNLLNEVGGYRSGIVLEDWYMWLMLSSLGYTLDYVGVVFAQYRRHPNNTSGNLQEMAAAREEVLLLFKDLPNYSLARAKAKLLSAFKMIPVRKREAFMLLFEAISIDPRIVFSFSFFNFMRKVVLPSRLF